MPAKYLQSSFNAGVLSPLMAGRLDLRQFYQGMQIGRNVVTRPQGGVRRRGGLKYLETLPGLIRRRFETITPTAPNGGTAGNANDDDLSTLVTTTTAIQEVDPYVVVHYDLAASRPIAFIDALGLKLDADASTDEFVLQTSTDNIAWTTLGDELEVVDDTARNYRRRGPVTARYVRLAKVGGSDLDTAHAIVAELAVWQETTDYLGGADYNPAVSEVRLVEFEFNTSQRYLLVFTDYNLAVFHEGERVADVPTPYPSEILRELDYAQSADTMILVHEDHAPQRLLRNELSSLWTLAPLTLSNIPRFDFNDASSPTPVAEVQVLAAGIHADYDQGTGPGWALGTKSLIHGDRFKIDLNGALTREISFAGDDNGDEENTAEARIQEALQELWTVGAGEGISVSRTGLGEFTVTFGGASADAYDLMIGVPTSPHKPGQVFTATRSTPGVSRKEPVWSATRGYPRSVTFFEGRLWFGGCRSLPTSVFGSVVNDYFNFEVGEGLDSDAIFASLVTDQLNAIVQIRASEFLQVFTTGAEFYWPRGEGEPLVPTGAGFKLTTRFGSKQIPPIEVDGSTLFAQATGKVLREFVYESGRAGYSAPPLSVMASHLLDDITDMAGWNGAGDEDTNLALIVNSDGSVATFNILESQEINAWTEWLTGTEGAPGEFAAVAVVLTDIYFAVRRTVGGVQRVFVEQLTDSYFMDAALSGTNGSPSSTITGLDHLEGEQVWARADGFYLDPATVSGGQITARIGGAAYLATDWEVGLAWVPTVQPMPLNIQTQGGDTMLRKKRMVKCRMLVNESLGVRVNGVLLPDQRWDVDNFDTAPTPVTGYLELGDTTGWTNEPLAPTIDQATPHPFELILLNVDLDIGGD